jgi:nucleotide-binding universal stress UspA family protein
MYRELAIHLWRLRRAGILPGTPVGPAAAEMGGTRLKRIRVPTDVSTPSLAALTQAVPYTQAVGGDLLVLHVVEGEPLRWYAADGFPETPSALVEPTAQFLLPQPPRKSVARDLAAAEIVRVARAQGADLILLGTHGRRGLRRCLEGDGDLDALFPALGLGQAA